MPAYPLAELVTQNVATVLGGVTTTNSYNVTLSVERYKKGGRNTVADLTAIIGFLDDQLEANDDTPDGFTSWIRPYWVLVYVFEAEASDTPYDQRIDMVRADISKALMIDFTRGGYAQNTFMMEPIRFDDPNDATGILIQFNVHYRHLMGDPYQPQ